MLITIAVSYLVSIICVQLKLRIIHSSQTTAASHVPRPQRTAHYMTIQTHTKQLLKLCHAFINSAWSPSAAATGLCCCHWPMLLLAGHPCHVVREHSALLQQIRQCQAAPAVHLVCLFMIGDRHTCKGPTQRVHTSQSSQNRARQ